MLVFKTQYKSIILAALSLVAFNSNAQYSWSNLPIIIQPVFKTDTVSITSFGAVADGVQLNTSSINKAIETCSNKGGGVVIVPKGIWITGPIEMKSNVNLHLQHSSMLLFTTDKSQYALVEGSYEGKPAARNQSPIWGNNLDNIAITGYGIVDGNGDAWRAVGKGQLTERQWKEKLATGGVLADDGNEWYPSQQFKTTKQENKSMLLATSKSLADYAGMKDFLRPNLVVFNNCKKVLLQGVIFQNSAAWCLHPLMCENLTIQNVLVKNPEYAQNGDGMDIESCKNFLIDGCILDVGDDAICIKSGKDEEGRKRGKPTENGIVRNNTVYKGHGGFVIGSEMSGGAKNIFIENCSFNGTDRGLRFKSTRGRGGVVENIYARNLIMKDILGEAIYFDLYYFVKFATDGKRDERPLMNEGTPVFKNMLFENIVCSGAKKGIFIRGLPEMPVKNISILNSTFTSTAGAELVDTDSITLTNINFKTTDSKTLLLADNSSNIKVNNLRYPLQTVKLLAVTGSRSKTITIENSGPLEGKISLGEGVSKSMVTSK